MVHLQQRGQRHGMGACDDGRCRSHLHPRVERIGASASLVRSHLANQRPHERVCPGRRRHARQFPQHLADQQRLELRATGHGTFDFQANQHRHRWHRVARRELWFLCLRLQRQLDQHHQLQHQQLLLELGRGVARVGPQLWSQPHPLVRVAWRRHRQLCFCRGWVLQRSFRGIRHHHELLPHHVHWKDPCVPSLGGNLRFGARH